MIQLLQIWSLADYEATPCCKCRRPAEALQNFYFGVDGKRVCLSCALANGFTVDPDLLKRIIWGFNRRR